MGSAERAPTLARNTAPGDGNPEWVALTALSDRVSGRYGVVPEGAIEEIIEHLLETAAYRVKGTPDEALPTWLARTSQQPPRIWVRDWDAAKLDRQSWTVQGSGRERLPVEGRWLTVKMFAEIRRRTWKRQAIDAAASAVAPSGDVTSPHPREAPRRNIPRIDYRDRDAELVEEMRRRIQAGTARGATDAARAVLSRAEGHGGDASKVKRLSGRYSEMYGDVPTSGHD